MRIQLTSVEETKNIDTIQRNIQNIFPQYTVTVVPNKYATKEGKEYIKNYCKNYYEQNKDKILEKKREKKFAQKAEKEMKIIEEHYRLKNAYKRELDR